MSCACTMLRIGLGTEEGFDNCSLLLNVGYEASSLPKWLRNVQSQAQSSLTLLFLLQYRGLS